MLNALFEYDFLLHAVLVSIFAGIICGIVGVIIVEKKMLMMSGGIAHTAYGGVGLGYLCGFEPILGAGLFAVLAALVIGKINRRGGVHTDIIIALLWSLGMALGIAFTGLMPGYPPDMNSYLFGNILSVTSADLTMIIPLCILTVLMITVFWQDWKSFLFDRDFAGITGLRTGVLEYSLLILIALCIVALIRVVGIILVIALLSAPAACAGLLVKTLKNRMLLAIGFCIVFCLAGLAISYYLEIASGATIVFVSALTYFAFYIVKKAIAGKN